VEIKIPQAPKIEKKETAADARKFSVVPLSALRDRRLTAQQKVVLAFVCSFANRAGITHVSQEKVAQELGVTQGRISRAIARLKRLGYIEQIGRAKPGLRGRTLRIVFDPSITAEDAVSIASTEEPDDLRGEDMKEQQAAELLANEHWTEKELRENKERLAKMLIEAFDTKDDKPDMYTSKPTDTPAVRKAKQQIRSRMRQMRGEMLSQSAYNATKKDDVDMSTNAYKHKELRFYAVNDIEQSDGSVDGGKRIQTQMMYEDYVVYFQKELFNQVKTEEDLQVCAQLADSGVTRETLDTYVRQYPSDTVTQIGKRILGTGC
jgi:hypothetical protein